MLRRPVPLLGTHDVVWDETPPLRAAPGCRCSHRSGGRRPHDVSRPGRRCRPCGLLAWQRRRHGRRSVVDGHAVRPGWLEARAERQLVRVPLFLAAVRQLQLSARRRHALGGGEAPSHRLVPRRLGRLRPQVGVHGVDGLRGAARRRRQQQAEQQQWRQERGLPSCWAQGRGPHGSCVDSRGELSLTDLPVGLARWIMRIRCGSSEGDERSRSAAAVLSASGNTPPELCSLVRPRTGQLPPFASRRAAAGGVMTTLRRLLLRRLLSRIANGVPVSRCARRRGIRRPAEE